MPPTYLVEDLGYLPITYVAQQEIFGHQRGKLGVLPALLLGARVARVLAEGHRFHHRSITRGSVVAPQWPLRVSGLLAPGSQGNTGTPRLA
jgi:hypothetical protein